MKKKISIVIVQGFGYSGSSAVAEFISTVAGDKKINIEESKLLKAFLHWLIHLIGELCFPLKLKN